MFPPAPKKRRALFMLDNRHIYSFVRLAANLHFGRTAEELNISQPTLSAHIRSLEERLGGALFVRTSRRVTLTPLGRAFLEDAQQILVSLAIAERNAEFNLQGGNAFFSIGVCGGSITSGLLHAVLKLLHTTFPGLTIFCQELPPASLFESLSAGRFDIVISNVYGLNMPQDFESFPMKRTDISLIANNDFSLVNDAGQLKVSELKEMPFLVYDMATNYPSIVENLFGFVPVKVMRTQSLRALMDLVDTRFSVAIVPSIDASLRGPSTKAYNLTKLVSPARVMEIRVLKRRHNAQTAVRQAFQVLRNNMKLGAKEIPITVMA